MLFAMSDKTKYSKNLYPEKKRKVWNKPTESFPNKWKRQFSKSDKGLCYNQGKYINEYGKGWHYNEYYDDSLCLIKTDESCGNELEADSDNDSGIQDKTFKGVQKTLIIFSLFANCDEINFTLTFS